MLTADPVSITTAELRVLAYLPTHLSLGDIADRVFVSRNTVKSHVAAIYRKLGVVSRSEAVAAAERLGLELPDAVVAPVVPVVPPTITLPGAGQ